MSTSTSTEPEPRVRDFLAWAGAGVLAAFAILTSASIGLFIIPFALTAIVLLVRSLGTRSASGLLAGLGLTLGALALRNADYTPCTDEPITTFAGESASCGGLDPSIVVPLAGVVVVAGVGVFLHSRWRSASKRSPSRHAAHTEPL